MKTILITAITCIITFWITTFLNIIVSKYFILFTKAIINLTTKKNIQAEYLLSVF